jgi:hypothetical protein
MSLTPNLAFPLLAAAQAQKHVTHNEALMLADALIQLAVLDRDLATPPATPADNARYIVGASPTGAWTGKAGQIARWLDAAWDFSEPKAGWLAYLQDEGLVAVFDGAIWKPATNFQNLAMLGVNATADATNRLSVSAAASLFNHAGAGHQIKLNKNAAADTAGILIQTGFSGRAEIGTAGDDLLHIKVSANGSSWIEAQTIDAVGNVGLGVATPITRLDVAGPIRCASYVKTALPSASGNGAGAMIFVSNEVGGAVLAFSDGTNWRRVTDRAVVA